MTPEALELLATGLKSFMEQKTFIDDVVFDEISKQARFLSNRKLAERNKMAKRRYSETKNLLRTKYCLVDKKRLQIEEGSADLGSSESLVSAEKDRLGVHAADVHLHSSQSAPATPALALRGCNNHKDLNRRSQSLEDEDLPSVETEGSDGVDIGASAATGGAGFEDVANYSIGLEKTQLVTINSAKPKSKSLVVKELAVGQDKISMCEEIENQPLLPESVSHAVGDLHEGDINNTIEHVDVDSSGKENDTEHLNNCFTTYRGDKFLEPQDVMIPLEEDMNYINNNNVIIQSPTIENGHIIYAPLSKPVPAERSAPKILPTAATDTGNGMLRQASIDSLASPQCSPTATSFLSPQNVAPEDFSALGATNSTCRLSPVLSLKQKQKAMQKRKSFHGFTSSILNLARGLRSTETSAKRCSVAEDSIDEEVSTSHDVQTECSLKDKEASRLLQLKRMDKTASLVTASSDSLPR